MPHKILVYPNLAFTLIRLTLEHIARYVSAIPHFYLYRQTASPKNVVIVGCSFAGYACAEHLARSLPSGWRVLIIEKNSHFRFTWLFPRVSVIPRHEEKSFIPYATNIKWAPCGVFAFKQANVVKVERDHVLLDDGDRIKFAFLVLATGMASRYPYDLDDTTKKRGMRYFWKLQQQVQAAQSIAIVGGGPVGVEIALDLKSLYQDKSVTLFHSRDRLCNNYGSSLHEICMKSAEELGVQVVLNERPQRLSDDGSVIKLTTGGQLTFDFVIDCIGQKTASSIIPGLPDHLLSSSNLIKVKRTLQVQDDNMTNVFAVGDVADTGAIKMGRAASLQGIAAANNILRSIRGRECQNYVPGIVEKSIDLSLGLGKQVIFIGQSATNVYFKSTTTDETLHACQVWKMFGATPFEDDTYFKHE